MSAYKGRPEYETALQHLSAFQNNSTTDLFITAITYNNEVRTSWGGIGLPTKASKRLPVRLDEQAATMSNNGRPGT